jgi:hypothetical protein
MLSGRSSGAGIFAPPAKTGITAMLRLSAASISSRTMSLGS